MFKKVMERKKGKRLMAWLMASVLTLSAVGVLPMSAEASNTVSGNDMQTVSDNDSGSVSDNNAQNLRTSGGSTNVYEFDASDLTAGTITADTVVGTVKGDGTGYFTLKATAEKALTVEAKNRNFDIDGTTKTTTNRLKTGGDGSATSRNITFTVTEGMKADVILCAESSNSSTAGNVTLFSEDGTAVGSAELAGGATPVTKWSDLEAGTYYIAGAKTDAAPKSINICYVCVSEKPKARPAVTYEFDASDLTTGTITVDTVVGTAKSDGTGYFTLKATSDKALTVEAKNRNFDIDGTTKTTTSRLKTGGDGSSTYRNITFTVTEGMKADIILCAESSNSSTAGNVTLFSADGTAVASAELAGGATPVTKWSDLAAGTYYIAGAKTDAAPKSINICYISVTESEPGSTTTAPEVTAVSAAVDSAEANKVNVTITATAGSEGSKYVLEAKKSTDSEWTVAGNADGTTANPVISVDLSGDKFGSGTWFFRAYGKGDSEQESKPETAVGIDYTLTLSVPEITGTTPGDSKVTVKWDAVREATGYRVDLYTVAEGGSAVKSVETTEKSCEVTGLTNDTKYWVAVTAIRNTETTVSERVSFRPYLPVDYSNAIPGMTIVDQTEEYKLTVLREKGEVMVAQSGTTGGVASTGRTNISFAQWATPVTGDFTFSADVNISSVASGTGRGLFLGAVSGTDSGAHWFTAGLRGDKSVRAYLDTYNGGSGSAKTIDSDFSTFTVGQTYELKVERVGEEYTVSVTDGTKSCSKTYAKSENAIEEALFGEVYPAIAFCGVNAELSNIVLTVGTEEKLNSTTWADSFSPFVGSWADVEAPVIKSVAVDNAAQKITVVCEGEVGATGAGEIVVDMYNEAGEVVGSQTASTFGATSHELTFVPTASGYYSFVATAVRTGEAEEKASAEVKAVDRFVLALTGTTVTTFNKGAGSVKVNWDAVKEATGYNVYYKLKDAAEYTLAQAAVTDTTFTITGLTVGSTYTFMVKAVRDAEEAKVESTVDKLVEDKVEREWFFGAFGDGVDSKVENNGFSGSVATNDLSVWELNKKGKMVPATVDGFAFYYTVVDPETENFTLSADVTVDQWTYTNGQEGFGLMAADSLTTNGVSNKQFWNNSYMAAVTKVEYYWDAATQQVSDSGTKYSMKLGVGAQEKRGVTAENYEDFLNGDVSAFSSKMTTLDTRCAEMGLGSGTYNMVGAYTNTNDLGDVENLQKTFHLTIQRNNTGYFVSYTNEDGETVTKKYYHGDMGDELTQIDKDNIYVGFFASRTAKISVKNVEFTTIRPEDDAPAEERPITYVTPNYSVESATISNSEDYELVYVGNADGKLTVKQGGKVVVNGASVVAGEKYRVATKLTLGNNKFDVSFTPDADYCPSKYERLSSYDTKNISFTVKYEKFDRNIIYVSPNGSANGDGSKENPKDIYSAIQYVQPGDYILLMEGTYSLKSTVTVQRGIDGTASNKIYMIADPEAKSRPVFDFNKACAGMVLAGDYWYFQGFDVTNSSNGQKGVQVSGDHNTLDDLHTYKNGNTGIQISRFKGTDLWEDWPSDNLILNCTSWLNADAGYEDADGFAAKLTIADGNVFDGCIAAYNADDGWDLFAKIESGPIGQVIIKNSIAFKNGYVIDDAGNEVDAGNGNGFKMGGSDISGHHIITNSFAFANKAKGFDSNSCPDIQVYGSTAYDNQSYNVAFYTNSAKNTDFTADGVLSYKKNNAVAEQLKLLGTQDTAKVYGTSNFYFNGTESSNADGVKVTDEWFVNLDTDAAIKGGITRNADGTINMNGYLEVTDVVPEGVGARATGTPSADIKLPGLEVGEADDDDDDDSSYGSSDEDEDITVDWNQVAVDLSAQSAKSANSNMDVTVGSESVIPASTLQTLKNEKVTLALHTGNGVTFSLSSQNVTRNAANRNLNLSVRPGQLHVPTSQVVEKSKDAIATKQISMVSHENFGMIVNLHVNMGAENANKFANLYRYNDATGRLEYMGSFRIVSNGQAMFGLTKGAEYLVTVTNKMPNEKAVVGEAHKVERGDTLSRIAARYGISVSRLLALNPDIYDANMIFTGQTIRVK